MWSWGTRGVARRTPFPEVFYEHMFFLYFVKYKSTYWVAPKKGQSTRSTHHRLDNRTLCTLQATSFAPSTIIQRKQNIRRFIASKNIVGKTFHNPCYVGVSPILQHVFQIHGASSNGRHVQKKALVSPFVCW